MDKTVIDSKCPSCDANLKFDPKSQKWICEYCGNKYELKDLEQNTKKYNKKEAKEEKKTQEKVKLNIYRCSNCGAEIVCDENTTATFCVYCKNTAVIKERLVGSFEPSLIIPFQKTNKDAIAAFKKIGRRHPLMPKEFSSEKNISEIRGIYIPFWLFSVVSSGGIEANCTKVRTWRSGDYLYTNTTTYIATREGNITITRVPNDGSVKFDDAIMNSIEPFDYSKLVPFNYSYLSGFLAEKYDVDEKRAQENAKKRMSETIKKELLSTIHGYSTVTIRKDYIDYGNMESEYVLLPVYMLNIKYKDKIYTFAYNGESGKMIGNMPIDKKRAVLFFLLAFIIVFIIVFALLYYVKVR